MHPIVFEVPLPWRAGIDVQTWWLCLTVPLLVGAGLLVYLKRSGDAAWAKTGVIGTLVLEAAGGYLTFAVLGAEHSFELPTSIPIYSYGVMLGTSMILGWTVVMRLGRKERYFRDPAKSDDFLANAFIVCALSALAGSRVLYMITNPGEFDTVAQFFQFRRGGLVAYGGFLGGFIAAIFWVRQYQGVALLRFSDGAAPALGLGLGLTRIGCYLYGCDFGGRLPDDAPSWLASAGTFPHWADGTGSPAWMWHVQERGLDQAAEHSYPVHPTQLYESAVGFLLFALCLVVWSRRKFHGQVILTLAMAYGVWRFLIEYVRDDPGRGEMFGFYTSQLISLAIVPIAAFAYFRELEQWKRKPYRAVRLSDPDPEPAPAASAANDTEETASAARHEDVGAVSGPKQPAANEDEGTKTDSPVVASPAPTRAGPQKKKKKK